MTMYRRTMLKWLAVTGVGAAAADDAAAALVAELNAIRPDSATTVQGDLLDHETTPLWRVWEEAERLAADEGRTVVTGRALVEGIWMMESHPFVCFDGERHGTVHLMVGERVVVDVLVPLVRPQESHAAIHLVEFVVADERAQESSDLEGDLGTVFFKGFSEKHAGAWIILSFAQRYGFLFSGLFLGLIVVNCEE